jgi:uncharacterized membrane protein
MRARSSLLAFAIGLAAFGLGLSGPVLARAQANFGSVVLSDDGSICSSRSLGGLSFDGQHLVVTASCGSGYEGVLLRDFRSRLPGEGRATTSGAFSGLSGDGRIAVGWGQPIHDGDMQVHDSEGLVLRDTGEVLGIGYLPNGDPNSTSSSWAYGISSDGSVVVGGATHECGDWVPVTWTEQDGLKIIPLDPAPPPGESSCPPVGSAFGASRDGRVIVGSVNDDTGYSSAFLWSAATGRQRLDEGPGASAVAQFAYAISADGSTVVGQGIFDGAFLPFVWTQEAGLVGLDDPEFAGAPDFTRTAWSVSEHGDVVVGGRSEWYDDLANYQGDEAFIWTPQTGIRDLRRYLESIGVNTAGWYRLISAWAVSEDGRTVVGTGIRAGQSVSEVFYASLEEAQGGVDLCAVGEPGCVGVEILARSGHPALKGEYAPEFAELFDTFANAAVNQQGDVAFAADLGLVDILWSIDLFDVDIFRSDPVGGARLCADGYRLSVAAGANVSNWASISVRSRLVLEEDGDIVFSGSVQGTGLVDTIARCHADSGGIEVLARVGDELADEPGVTLTGLTYNPMVQVDDSGRVSFPGNSSDAIGSPYSVGSVLFATNDQGGLEARLRSPLPNPDGDPPVDSLDIEFHAASGAGVMALTARAIPLAETTPSDLGYGLWGTDSTGSLTLVARPGDPAPGFPPTMTFESFQFSAPSVNSRDGLVTTAEIGSSEDPTFIRRDIWRWTPDAGLAVLVSADDALPGLDASITLQGFRRQTTINDLGDVLVFAFLLPDPPVARHSEGYWLRTVDGEFVPLLRSEMPAPGLPEGVTLANSGYDENAYPYELLSMYAHAWAALTPSGNTLMDFWLEGAGIDPTNDRAVYRVDRQGHPTLVFRRGDRIPVAHDDVRTIADFRIAYGLVSGLGRSPLNDHDDVVATLDFTDGTQAVAKFTLPVPVPEPDANAALATGSLAVLFLFRLARRRPGSTRTPRRRGSEAQCCRSAC